MTGLARLRRRRTAWGRRVLGLYVVAWTAIIVQPCAVAGEVEHDCPHCPPEMSHEMAHSDMSPRPDCSIGDQLNLESRSLQVKLKDSANPLPAAIFEAPYEPGSLTTRGAFPAPSEVLIKPGGPPLNVLHCVYLK